MRRGVRLMLAGILRRIARWNRRAALNAERKRRAQRSLRERAELSEFFRRRAILLDGEVIALEAQAQLHRRELADAITNFKAAEMRNQHFGAICYEQLGEIEYLKRAALDGDSAEDGESKITHH